MLAEVDEMRTLIFQIFYLIATQTRPISGLGHNRRDCDYDINLLWSAEVAHVPFASAPVIADINADGKLDIIAAPFTEVVTVLSAEDGRVLKNTKWPQQHIEKSVHASPLLYDINADRVHDILLISSDGEIFCYAHDGEPLHNKTFQFPPLYVHQEWYKHAVSVEQLDIHSYILDEPPEDAKEAPNHIPVDPHVLATPVIADLNADNILEEMVIPVSYYYDTEFYSKYDNMQQLSVSEDDLDKYLAGGLVLFNLTSMEIIRTIHLELTKVTAEYPGYVLFSPTLVDLDGNGGELEIITGTSGGQIHVLDTRGNNRPGFPIPQDSIHGQVTVADVNQDGFLEIVAMDTSANVVCYKRDGELLWETQVTGSTTSGFRVADINQDGVMDVVFSTNEGLIWVLRGDDGVAINRWPFRVGRGLTGIPLVTQLSTYSDIDVLALSDDEHLHIISGTTRCRQAVNLRETSFVGILSHDLVSQSQGLEMLVATKDGTLLCLGRTTDMAEYSDNRKRAVLDGWPAETRGYNGFTYSQSKAGILLHPDTDGLVDVTGHWMTVTMEIIDDLSSQNDSSRSYRVNTYFGSTLLGSLPLKKPGTYTLHVKVPPTPAQGHIKVVMINQHGQVFEDGFAVRFNMLFLHDLPWLLLCPFVAMAAILLLLHGFPAADLLPITHQDKGR